MRIDAEFSLVLMSAMTNSVCILVMAMKRNDGIQPKMIAMVATGVLPLSSDANEAMLKAAHKMTAKIMDRAGRRRVITRSGSALRDESPF